MGRRKRQTQRVTQYFTSIQYAICHGVVERLLAIRVNDKVVDINHQGSGNAVLDVHQLELFGGIKKEGGVSGRLAWQDGSDDQLLDSYVASKKGTVPTNLPGYRGIATAYFTERPTDAHRGFYWSSNQPIIPPTHFRVTRIDRSWRPDIAGIANDSATTSVDYQWSLVGGSIPPGSRNDTAIIASNLGYVVNADPSDVVRVFPAAPSSIGFSEANLNTASDPQLDGTWRWVLGIIFNDTPGLGAVWDATGAAGYSTPEAALAAAQAAGPYSITGYSKYRFYVFLEFVSGVVTEASGGLSATVTVTTAPQIDMNPAHMIRECLVNSIWGLGLPDSALDMDMFEAAAETLYAENFGLSMIWTQQAEIQEFVGEILSHIQATLYVNPMNGKLSLKLIRDDYDAATLDILDPSNSTVTSFKRRSPAEITNEIAVSWTNPDTEKSEVVTLQSLGSIVANNGEIVTDNRNYYGVRRADLAVELAGRDLAAATAPLSTAEVEADRRFSRKVPGDVIKLTDPENGADELIMRVLKVDYGRPGASKVQLTLTEDVFSYARPRFISQPTTQNDTGQSRVPTPATSAEFITLNRFLNRNVSDGIDDLVDPETQVAFFVASDNPDTFNMRVLQEVPQIIGGVAYEDTGDYDLSGRGLLTVPLAAEVTSEIVLPTPIIGAAPSVGGFAIIGPTGIPEANHEIVLITAVNVGTGAWTLRRGVLDTTPRQWAIGTPVRYFTPSSRLVNPEASTSGISQNYRFLTRTSRGLLAEASAPVVPYVATDRLYAPTRPANVRVEGVAFGDVLPDLLTDIEVEWANRNASTEDAVVLAWDEASVTPEAGQLTNIRLFDDATDALITEYVDLAGTSYSFPVADMAGADVVRIEVSSSRDGFESIQAHSLRLIGSGARVMEDGADYRSTENASEEIRTMED